MVPFTGESERLPIGRVGIRKQNPIPVDPRSGDERAEERAGGGMTWRFSSLCRGLLQIGENPFYRLGPGVAAVTEIEDEAGIAHCLAAEPGCGSAIVAQKLFNFSQQMHLSVLMSSMRLGCTVNPNAFPTCLGSYL
jgi:hypothetical protein